MTFYECLMECATSKELIEQFNRLTGRKVGVAIARSPIEAMIDASTGYQETFDAQVDQKSRQTPSFRWGKDSEAGVAGLVFWCVLSLNVLFYHVNWRAAARSCKVARRPQSALPELFLKLGKLASQYAT